MSTSVNIFRNTISSSSSGGGKEEQTKSVTITENGTTTITPDEGKTLSSVEVNTEVSGGTVVSAVGKSVYLYIDPLQEWDENSGNYHDDLWDFQFSNDEYRLIAVTTDGNIPRQDRQNVLFLVSTNDDEGCEVLFRLEREQEIFNARIYVHPAEPPR